MSEARFDWRALLARILFSLLVVFAVYNPSGRSYWHWIWNDDAGFWPKFTMGLVLLAVHASIWMTVLAVLRWKGVVTVLLILIGGWISISQAMGPGLLGGGSIAVVPLLLLSLLYAWALSWAYIMHRVTGVVHVEKVK